MWSQNSARALGASIGKTYPDLCISSRRLLEVTDAQLIPVIRLRRSDEERSAQERSGLFGLLLFIGLAGAYATVDVALPGLLLPDSWNRWGLPIGLGSAVVLLLAALAGESWRRAAFAASQRRDLELASLREAAFQGARDAVKRRRAALGVVVEANSNRGAYRPDRIPSGVTPRGAEELVAQWMRHLGEPTAAVTQFQGDGGMDVIGARFVAQVKHFASNVGVAPIREISGAARVANRRALFFTSTGYSHGAIDFADRAGVALYVYSAEKAELRAMNSIATNLLDHGLH